MKNIGTKLLLSTAILGLSTFAFAGSSGSIKLDKAASVNGTKIAAGEYKVKVDDAGTVTFHQGKQVVATTKAKVVTQEKAARSNTYTTSADADGSTRLKSIQFENKKELIVLSDGVESKSGN